MKKSKKTNTISNMTKAIDTALDKYDKQIRKEYRKAKKQAEKFYGTVRGGKVRK
jgi:ribosome-associated translation inhibitor RaiA